MQLTKYEGSRPYRFRQKRFFLYFSLNKNSEYVQACVRHATPGTGPLLAQGA